MPWRAVAKHSGLSSGLIAAALGLFLTLGSAYPVSAIGTEVGVKVCGSNPSAALIDITQPSNDSVIDQSTATVRGNVVSASQIIVDLNGIYSSTIAIASGQTTFQAEISLPEGTHTISLRATEICGGADDTDSIVLTYQPAARPSTGDHTDTAVDANNGQGVVVTGAPLSSTDENNSIEQVPLVGPVAKMMMGLAEAVGLDMTLAAGGSSVMTGVARVVVTSAALTSVVMAGVIAPYVVQAVPGVSELVSPLRPRSLVYLGWVIRGIGVLAFALAYFL